MDRRAADAYLQQWAAWSLSELKPLDVAVSRWQRELQSGYAEESPRADVRPGPDAIMIRVDATVSRVNLQYPAMGAVLKRRYWAHRHVESEMLETALLRFVSAWCEINPEVA